MQKHVINFAWPKICTHRFYRMCMHPQILILALAALDLLHYQCRQPCKNTPHSLELSVAAYTRSKMSSLHEEKSSTFLQLMSQYGLRERQYNQQVSDINLEKLSRSGCKQWKSLPPHLELEAIVAEDIDKSQKGEREKRHEFLLTWNEMKGSSTTYKQLITALLKIKCRRDAEKLSEMLKKSVPQSELDHAGKNARIYVECIS